MSDKSAAWRAAQQAVGKYGWKVWQERVVGKSGKKIRVEWATRKVWQERISNGKIDKISEGSARAEDARG